MFSENFDFLLKSVLKVKRCLLGLICMDPFLKKVHCFHIIMKWKQQQHAKSVIDALISVKFNSEYCNAFKIEHTLCTSRVGIFWFRAL